MSDDIPGRQAAAEQRPAAGDDKALFAASYAELRKLAERELRRYPGMGMSATTLVHEAYLNLAERPGIAFAERGKLIGYTARAMRGLLIDFARRQQAVKRGAGFAITQLSTKIGEEVADAAELARISDALDELARLDPRLAEIVDLKYFCGFSFAEIARLRDVSERTVQRDWEKARLLLFRDLETSA
ncbi:MAG TPA: ECF-type sigma factor [Steroidobacteraceae bacterium]|jgi:RNA polymerase sigma factor (TIGR02999 family)|nr:ECF-type sigma factor [Steroidobacteraceae bacterium]